MLQSIPVLARMKELWSYLLFSFTDWEKYVRRLLRVDRLDEYEDIIDAVFREQEPIAGGCFDPAAL